MDLLDQASTLPEIDSLGLSFLLVEAGWQMLGNLGKSVPSKVGDLLAH